MATLKKLDTFILRDKFCLTEDALFEEAQASTFRRAEMMEWSDVSVVRTSAAVFKDGEFNCHTFDILGAGVASKDDKDGVESKANESNRDGVAARELNP